MNQAASDTVNIEALISGEVKGQVAIGSNILQIGSVHGGVVNIAMPGAITPPRPRPVPVFLRPRPFPGLLDRRDETGRVAAALRLAQPIEIDGEPGLGKTSLLRYLAYYAFDTKYPDGVVHLSLRGQSASDVLQALFEAFYESGQPFNVKPTDVQIRYALQDKQALILFDDVDLARDELQTAIDAAPGCAFVLTSPERRLWSEGAALALAGLPLEDALNLIERELGRPLTADERPRAEALCIALEGHPLRLIQAAAIFREEQHASALGLLQLNTSAMANALAARLVASLSEPERRIVAALAALGDASVRAEHLSGMTGLSDVESILDGLVQRALLRAEGSGYRLDAVLIQELQQLSDAHRWSEKALVYFLDWIERHRDQFDRIVSEIDVLNRVLDYATKARHWSEALRLTMALEGALALARRWGAWERVLRIGLQAARELRDRPAEAWALHQIGTRALCLEHTSIARNSLIQALRLRESIDDQQGAVVTRHNLNILLGPPAPPKEPPQQPPSTPLSARGVPLLSNTLLAVVVIALMVILMFEAIRSSQAQTSTPSPVGPPTAAPTLTSTPRLTDTPTAAPTATSTPMPTDTATATPTLIPWPVLCIPRYGWPIYIVQYGDTLSSIARRTGSTTYELKLANCLIGDYLYVGQQLFVLRLPVPPPTATPTPTPTDTATATPTATFTPTPTATPTPTDTPTVIYPKSIVNFSADGYTLYWYLQNVRTAYLSGGEFNNTEIGNSPGSVRVSPSSTTVYSLRAVLLDGSEVFRSVTINVTPIPTTVPDTPIPVPPTLTPTPTLATPTPTSTPPTPVLN